LENALERDSLGVLGVCFREIGCEDVNWIEIASEQGRHWFSLLVIE
jgi:hypothetical protein